jgi:hypothetical protein
VSAHTNRHGPDPRHDWQTQSSSQLVGRPWNDHVRSRRAGEDSVFGIGDGALATQQSTTTMHQVRFGSERASVGLSVVANVHVGRHREFRAEVICAQERIGRCNVGQSGEHPSVDRTNDSPAHRVAQFHGHDRVRSVFKAFQVHAPVKGMAAKRFVVPGKLSSLVIGGHGGQSSTQQLSALG